MGMKIEKEDIIEWVVGYENVRQIAAKNPLFVAPYAPGGHQSRGSDDVLRGRESPTPAGLLRHHHGELMPITLTMCPARSLSGHRPGPHRPFSDYPRHYAVLARRSTGHARRPTARHDYTRVSSRDITTLHTARAAIYFRPPRLGHPTPQLTCYRS